MGEVLAFFVIVKDEGNNKECLNWKTLLVMEGIGVKVVVIPVGDRFCKKMDVVTAVENKYIATILTSSQTRPSTPSHSYTSNRVMVHVINGAYCCCITMLMEVAEIKFSVTVEIPSGPFRGRMVDKVE
jgi:DNA/RNA-binding protein KIN17